MSSAYSFEKHNKLDTVETYISPCALSLWIDLDVAHLDVVLDPTVHHLVAQQTLHQSVSVHKLKTD